MQSISVFFDITKFADFRAKIAELRTQMSAELRGSVT